MLSLNKVSAVHAVNLMRLTLFLIKNLIVNWFRYYRAVAIYYIVVIRI